MIKKCNVCYKDNYNKQNDYFCVECDKKRRNKITNQLAEIKKSMDNEFRENIIRKINEYKYKIKELEKTLNSLN